MTDINITIREKAALLLSGISYQTNYKHHPNKYCTIDFGEYEENIKQNIVNYFAQLNIDFDIYLSTNDKKKDELIAIYNPTDAYFDNDNNRIYKTIKGLELIINKIKTNSKQYKFIIITKFDIYFLKKFVNIDLNKLNIISILEHPNACDDNFHLFPISYLDKFYELLVNEAKQTNYNHLLLHHLIHKFEQNFKVKYLCNEYKVVNELSFFKLRFFDTIDLKLNKYIFSKNVWYSSLDHNSQMMILNENNNKIICFNKIINKPRSWCWIGYDNIKKGCYNLTFEIYSDKDIINFNFIKLHNPITFYSTQNILANTWTTINLIINIREDNDLLCLIFDDFPDTINLQFKNIELENIVDNHIIINEMDINILSLTSNKCILNKLDENTFEFIKEKTKSTIPFIWCGFNIKPQKVKTIMKFDILFKSDIPNKSDNLFIKTHDPIEHYNDWLSLCKKDEFVHIELPLYVSKNKQLIIFIMDECFKSVHFIIKNIEFIPDNINYKFISFYTQGDPYDKCFNLTSVAKEYENKMKPYVDKTRLYNGYELKSNPDTEYLVKEFPTEPQCNLKTHLIGYLRWKPYIILNSLLELNDGDILYYRDCNTSKYPAILQDIEYTISTLNCVLKDIDIFFPVEEYPKIKMSGHIKREVFEYFNLYNQDTLNSPLLNASIVVCRKNDKTIKLLDEWLLHCKNDDLISSEIKIKQHNDFKWNTQEQAIMNLLIKTYVNDNLLPNNIFKYSFSERIFSKKKLQITNCITEANKNCSIIVTGQIREFKSNQQYLLNMLLLSKKQYSNLLIIFVLNTSDVNDINIIKQFCDNNNLNNIIIQYGLNTYKNDFKNKNSQKILNHKYQNIKHNYLNLNNNAKKEIINIDEYLFKSSVQYHQLKVGINELLQYEKNNNILFDVIMRTRFDVYYQELFYPKVYDINDELYYKIFYNNINLDLAYKTCNKLNINTVNQLCSFLSKQKINLPNDRINFDLINVSLGGWNYYNSQSLNNIINGNNDILYSFNDFFYFGKRDVFIKLCSLFDDCFLLDNGDDLNIHNIYAPESQLIMFCAKNNIQILMYDENTKIYNGRFGLMRNK